MADKHWVLMDGDCTLCRRAVSWVHRHDPHHRFEIVPYQDAPSPPMTPELFRTCEHAVHVVTADGITLRAGTAVLYILDNIDYPSRRFRAIWSALLHILAARPFIWLIELLYRVVARNRPLFAYVLFTHEKDSISG